MCYVFDFSWSIVVIIVQSGLKLYDFTILAAGVEPNKSVIRSHKGRLHHVSTYACLIELKTEFKLEQAISMQLRNKTTVVGNVRIHHLGLPSKRKAQNALVLRLEVAGGMVKTTLKQL